MGGTPSAGNKSFLSIMFLALRPETDGGEGGLIFISTGVGNFHKNGPNGVAEYENFHER